MTASTRKSVLVAMSGGVDSSVAAALLRDAGHDVTGVTLRLWGGDSDSGCCSVGDVEDARRVAAQLDIPHYVFNFADDFTAAVVDPYVDAYAAGRTPNPCVECNRSIKFGRLLDRARALGYDAVATGHHARVRTVPDGDGRFELLRGVDDAKDQSYVLYMLGPEELADTLLPVGELTKAEVREHAARLGLRTASQAREHGRLLHHPRRPALVPRRARAGPPGRGRRRRRAGRRTPRGRRSFHRRAAPRPRRRGGGAALRRRRRRGRARPSRSEPTTICCARTSSCATGRSSPAVEPEPDAVLTAQVRAHGVPVPARRDGDVVRFERAAAPRRARAGRRPL